MWDAVRDFPAGGAGQDAAALTYYANVASVGSYNATYGALGGVVVFLIWMWITHAALIVGLATADRLGGPRPG